MLPGAYPELGDLERRSSATSTRSARSTSSPSTARPTRPGCSSTWSPRRSRTRACPFALRARPPRPVGDYIERTEPADLDRVVPLLEHHFWRSDRRGQEARVPPESRPRLHRPHTPTTAAIAYYERLVPLLEGLDKARDLLALGKTCELAGDWSKASASRHRGARARHEDRRSTRGRRGPTRRSRRSRESRAATTRRRNGSTPPRPCMASSTTISGWASSRTCRGRLRRSRADTRRLGSAISKASRSASGTATRISWAGSSPTSRSWPSTRSDFVESRRLNEEALAIRTSIGDRWAIALSLNNLAVIDLYERQFQQASDRYEESVRLAREVGDPWLLSLAYFNLGKARKGLGDDARARVIFGESIVAFQRLDDPYDLAEVIEDIAVIAAASQPAIGLELLGGADRMRADIGAARPAARESELVADLAEARATLGAAADATIEVGRARASTRDDRPGSRGLRGALRHQVSSNCADVRARSRIGSTTQ